MVYRQMAVGKGRDVVARGKRATLSTATTADHLPPAVCRRPFASAVAWAAMSVDGSLLPRLSALIRCVTALVLLSIATHAAAHPAPFSFLDLYLDPDGTHGALVVHDFDAAHEL